LSLHAYIPNVDKHAHVSITLVYQHGIREDEHAMDAQIQWEENNECSMYREVNEVKIVK
jgi:hypothetical protein